MGERVRGPILVLRFDVESAAALVPAAQRAEAGWPAWIEESLKGVASICRVLADLAAPASFFLVGELLERAGADYAALLRDRGLDIGNHTYTHRGIWDAANAHMAGTFPDELRRTGALIERHFGRAPTGFTAPGGYYRGLRGKAEALRVLWEGGYRYITTDAQPSPGGPRRGPAPMTQPYWYAEEGFPGLLEAPITGWHCNMLFNSGRQNDNWRPAPGFPDGGILERLPTTVEEGFAVRRRELDYAVERRLVYAPCMHPWSVHRFDAEAGHVRRLIEAAKAQGVAVMSCKDIYETWRAGAGQGSEAAAGSGGAFASPGGPRGEWRGRR